MNTAHAELPMNLEWVFFDVGNTLLLEGAVRVDRNNQLLAAVRRFRPEVTLRQLSIALSHAWRTGAVRPVQVAVET